MAQGVGSRTTSQIITTENTLVRVVDEDLVLLEPNETPLVTFVMNVARSKKGRPSPKVEWLEDDYVARWAVKSVDTVNANASSTSIGVTDGTLFVAGDLFQAPPAASSSAVGEIFRVVSVSGDTLTVIRAISGTSLVTLNPSVSLRLLGSAAEENATPPSAKFTNVATKSTYMQIFTTAVDLSKTNVAAKVYGAPEGDRNRLQKKALREHKIKMNSQFLFGKTSQSLTGGPNSRPIRYADGINSMISTNIYDAGGVLTRKGFEAFSRMAFRYGSKKKLLLAAPKIISAIHDWAGAHLQINTSESMFGVDIQRVTTGHGQWLLARDWMLEDGVSGQNGFAGWAFSVDIEDNCEYIYLQGNGESRDTKMMENVVLDGRDGYVDVALSECGMIFKHEKKHAKLFNVTDYVG